MYYEGNDKSVFSKLKYAIAGAGFLCLAFLDKDIFRAIIRKTKKEDIYRVLSHDEDDNNGINIEK